MNAWLSLFVVQCFVSQTFGYVINKDTMMSYSDAKAWCAAQYRTLASIHSATDQQNAKLSCVQVLPQASMAKCWIGLTDVDAEGTYEWEDGTPIDYGFNDDKTPSTDSDSPWGSGQPDDYDSEDCVELHHELGQKWNDADCDTATAYAVCNDECLDGYVISGDTCTDADECTEGTDTCDQNARCTNTEGSFECDCNDGYGGDGETCTLLMNLTPLFSEWAADWTLFGATRPNPAEIVVTHVESAISPSFSTIPADCEYFEMLIHARLASTYANYEILFSVDDGATFNSLYTSKNPPAGLYVNPYSPFTVPLPSVLAHKENVQFKLQGRSKPYYNNNHVLLAEFRIKGLCDCADGYQMVDGSCVYSGAKVSFTISTLSDLGVESAEAIGVALQWNDFKYPSCTIIPDTLGETYDCAFDYEGRVATSSADSPNKAIFSNDETDAPYIMTVTVVDETGETFVYSKFCVPNEYYRPTYYNKNQIGLDNANCDDYPNLKRAYAFLVDNDHAFPDVTLLLPETENNEARLYAPKLVKACMTVGDCSDCGLPSGTVKLAAKWDIAQLGCDIASPLTRNTQYCCDLSATACYDNAASAVPQFEVYVQNVNDNQLAVTQVSVENSEGRVWSASDFCIPSGDESNYINSGYAGTDCVYDSAQDQWGYFRIGGSLKDDITIAFRDADGDDDTPLSVDYHTGSNTNFGQVLDTSFPSVCTNGEDTASISSAYTLGIKSIGDAYDGNNDTFVIVFDKMTALTMMAIVFGLIIVNMILCYKNYCGKPKNVYSPIVYDTDVTDRDTERV
eukprot:239461_1